jgi:hypothetical protein
MCLPSKLSECILLGRNFELEVGHIQTKQTNSLAFSPQANYTDWVTATCRRNLLPTIADRGVSRGQRGGSPTVVNLSFLDRAHSNIFILCQRAADFATLHTTDFNQGIRTRLITSI